MKIVYRTTYLRSFHRLHRFSEMGSALGRRVLYLNKPYVLTPDDELLKYGYRYVERNFKAFASVLIGLFSGAFVYYSYILSMQHEITTFNPYKLNQHMKVILKLMFRMGILDYGFLTLGWAMQPYHEFTKYLADTKLPTIFQRVLRLKQYRYFMKKKNRKYDILDLGVIENFPMPGQIEEQKVEKPKKK